MKLELWYPITPFFITQKFGENLSPFYAQLGMKGHNGWDMVGNDGQLIRAAQAGIVTFTGEDSAAGLGVVIRTNIAYEYGTGEAFYKMIYWHCKPGSFRVKPGDKVEAGDPIAECDNTGMSTGSHLHFGLKPVQQGEQEWAWANAEQTNGYFGAIDPAPFWNGKSAETCYTMLRLIAAIWAAIGTLAKLILKGR